MQVSKPKVAEKQAAADADLSGIFFQRSKKSTPKREKQQQIQETKQGRCDEGAKPEEATSTPHTRTAGVSFTIYNENINQNITACNFHEQFTAQTFP